MSKVNPQIENRTESKRPPGNPAWQPGQSGNPGGRPKGLACLVREKVKDGKVLVDFWLCLLKGEKAEVTTAEGEIALVANPTLEDQKDAAKWLADRGWRKAAQIVAGDEDGGPLRVQGSIPPELMELLSQLSAEMLKQRFPK